MRELTTNTMRTTPTACISSLFCTRANKWKFEIINIVGCHLVHSKQLYIKYQYIANVHYILLYSTYCCEAMN